MDSEGVAASVLLWDERLVWALMRDDPKAMLETPTEVPRVLIFKGWRADFERFKEIVKNVFHARWVPEEKAWEVRPKLRDYTEVVDAIEELNEMGCSFVLVTDGKKEVELTGDDVDAAYMKGSEFINELASDLTLSIKFSTKKNKELFLKLLDLAPYYKGRFYLPPFGRLPESLARRVAEEASDSLALVASRRKEEEEGAFFMGNSVMHEVTEEEFIKLQDILAPYEDCDLESPEIERERRENALSYCDYRWTVVGGELTREGKLVRLYDLAEHRGKKYVRVYRGLYVRLLRHLNETPVKLYAKLPEEPDADFLRDYQREAVSQALKFMRLQGAATIQAATGAGKTEMAVALAKTLLDKGIVKKVFFLSLNRTLNVQAVMRFKKYGVDAGLVDSENFQVDKPVVACTVQTLYKALVKVGKAREFKEETDEEVRMDYVELSEDKASRLFEEYMNAGLVIVDEVQHVPARTVSEVIKANPWTLRLGLSATPWRDDGKDVMIYALIGEVVPRRITSSELIERGYLVPVRIVMVKRKLTISDEVERELAGLQGAQKYVKLKNFVFYDDRRNEEIAEIVEKLPKPVLVLVKEIKHAHELCKKIKEKGVSCAVLTGKESSQQRESVLRMVMNERVDAVVATTLADEGLDLPPLRALVLAAGGRSQTRTLQRVGRITRPYKDKKEGLVVDVWDDDRDVGGIFYRQGLARKRLYESEPLWRVEVLPMKKFVAALRGNALRSRFNS